MSFILENVENLKYLWVDGYLDFIIIITSNKDSQKYIQPHDRAIFGGIADIVGNFSLITRENASIFQNTTLGWK